MSAERPSPLDVESTILAWAEQHGPSQPDAHASEEEREWWACFNLLELTYSAILHIGRKNGDPELETLGLKVSDLFDELNTGSVLTEERPLTADERREVRNMLARERAQVNRHRRAVFARDQHRCRYCGKPGALTLDHVWPVSKGGTHDQQNLVACCLPCNLRKGARFPHEAGMVLR